MEEREGERERERERGRESNVKEMYIPSQLNLSAVHPSVGN